MPQTSSLMGLRSELFGGIKQVHTETNTARWAGALSGCKCKRFSRHGMDGWHCRIFWTSMVICIINLSTWLNKHEFSTSKCRHADWDHTILRTLKQVCTHEPGAEPSMEPEGKFLVGVQDKAPFSPKSEHICIPGSHFACNFPHKIMNTGMQKSRPTCYVIQTLIWCIPLPIPIYPLMCAKVAWQIFLSLHGSIGLQDRTLADRFTYWKVRFYV